LPGGLHPAAGPRHAQQFGNGKPDELFQTSVDRMATLSMRDNLQSLYLLMDKLYLRNPTSGSSLATSTPPPPPGRSASPSSSASPGAARRTA
jgi:hypothetical protein